MSGRLTRGPRGLVDLGNCWLVELARSPNYYVAWNAGQGTRELESTGTADLQQALLIAQAVSERLQRAATGEPAPACETPVVRCLLAYWEEHASKLPSAAAARSELARLRDCFGGCLVSELSEEAIATFKDEQLARGYALSSVSRSLSTLRAALNHACKKRRLASKPFIPEVFGEHDRETQTPKGRRLSEAEMARLFAAAADRQQRRYLLLLAGTLGRPQAVRALTREQVDVELGCIRLNPRGRLQTKKVRPVVPLIGTLRDELAGAAPGPLLAIDGRPVTDFKAAWRKLRARAQLDEAVKPYSFRHTFAYWLKRQRFPDAEIGQYLGHKPANRMRSTAIYIGEEFESLIPAGAAIDEILKRVLADAARM